MLAVLHGTLRDVRGSRLGRGIRMLRVGVRRGKPITREQRERLVFIDETGTTTKMTRLRGRSTKGTRLNSKAPFGHWGTQTFVAGLKCDGLIAPWVLDAPMNRVIFETYVETQLAPALKRRDPARLSVRARSGGSSSAKASILPVARWRD